MDRPQRNPSTLKPFHQFQRLPREIQDQIWSWACYSLRIIKVEADGLEMYGSEIFSFSIPIPSTDIFSICSDSRRIATEAYSSTWRLTNQNSKKQNFSDQMKGHVIWAEYEEERQGMGERRTVRFNFDMDIFDFSSVPWYYHDLDRAWLWCLQTPLQGLRNLALWYDGSSFRYPLAVEKLANCLARLPNLTELIFTLAPFVLCLPAAAEAEIEAFMKLLAGKFPEGKVLRSRIALYKIKQSDAVEMLLDNGVIQLPRHHEDVKKIC
jgi:hypothetical protein